MKKLEILTIGLLSTQLIMAQIPFHEGSLIVSENYGGDRDMVTIHFTSTPENPAQRISSKINSSYFTLGGEYGLSDLLGIGITGSINNYYINPNQLIKTWPLVASENAEATINIHYIHSRRIDAYCTAGYGFSQLNYNINDGSNTTVAGSGAQADIGTTGRLYFGPFGINMSLDACMRNYDHLQGNQPSNETLPASWSSMAYGANIGILYRIL